MDIEAFFEGMPFADLLGVEVTEAADGHAEGQLQMRQELSWNQDRLMAHGGVTFTLADTVGGAALVSLNDQPVPTIDMRIDYLERGHRRPLRRGRRSAERQRRGRSWTSASTTRTTNTSQKRVASTRAG